MKLLQELLAEGGIPPNLAKKVSPKAKATAQKFASKGFKFDKLVPRKEAEKMGVFPNIPGKVGPLIQMSKGTARGTSLVTFIDNKGEATQKKG